MIRLNVFIKVDEAKRADVLKAAVELTACSLKDRGCIAYDIFESATRKDVLMICETWQNEEDLDLHQKSSHFVSSVGKMQELASPKIEKFQF